MAENAQLARFHVDNLPPSASPERLAQHLGLIDMGRGVRVDLVISNSTGKCSGQGVVTSPRSKINFILSHNQLLFMGRRLVIELITDTRSILGHPPNMSPENLSHHGRRGDAFRNHQGHGRHQDHRAHAPVAHGRSSRLPAYQDPLPSPPGMDTSDMNNNADSVVPGALPYCYPMIDAAAILTHPKFRHDLRDVISRAKSVGLVAEEGLGRSVSVACLALTLKTETHGEPIFNVAWCCQPHQMGHRQHPNLKMGVQQIVTLGMSVRGSREAHDLAKQFPGFVYWAAGIHPHEARGFRQDSINQLEQLVSSSKNCVAIGECGLDYLRNFSPRDLQLKAFEAQVHLACRLQKPLILHVRNADNDLREVLNKYHDQLPPTLVHCFSGQKQDALKYIAMGFYLGITGFVCKPNHSEGLRKLLEDEELPLDKIVLETDCPFMFPYSNGALPEYVSRSLKKSTVAIVSLAMDQRCEPCMLGMLVEVVAGYMKKPPALIARHARENAAALFGFPNK